MIQPNQEFKAAAVGNNFTANYLNFDKLLAQYQSQEVIALRQKMRQQLREYREIGILSVAFVGQYSSGKSTIISALTGRRDIPINSDITTDKTISYNWHGVKLIDTPGLFTERQDHDQITYQAIAQADLLIFCLSSMLFDAVTVENFKQLAYAQGYRWKMMLVINKMSDEAGDDQQKISAYRQSLAEALYPYSLDEFPISFIDGKDYCEGIDKEDNFLLEVSRFPTFINALNHFIERRGYLSKFDTPVRITLSFVDQAQLSLSRNSDQDTAFLEVLTRLSRVVIKERERLRTQARMITLRMSSAIVKEGTIFAAVVEREQDLQELNKQAEVNIHKYYQQAEKDLESVVNTAITSIQQRVEKVLQSQLFQTFFACLSKNNSSNNNDIIDNEQLKIQVNSVTSIAAGAGVELTTGINPGEVKTTSSERCRQTFNFQLKDWQALDIPKTMSNISEFISYALAMVAVRGKDDKIDQEQQMVDIRRYITSQFHAIAQNLDDQVKIYLWEVERQLYGDIEQKITAAYSHKETAIANSNNCLNQLAEIRQNFQAIMSYITQVLANQVLSK